MKIPQFEADILKNAYCKLHDAYHNIQCLFTFLKKEYPSYATIEFTVLLNGLLRMQDIENIMSIHLDYPVFGKELEMANQDMLMELLRKELGVDKYGLIDIDDSVSGLCINNALHLYEMEV